MRIPLSALFVFFLFALSGNSVGGEIPARYAGVWELTAYVKDGVSSSPENKHYLILTTDGEMTRVNDLEHPTWKNAFKQKIKIDEKGMMTTAAPNDGILILGTATVSNGELNLESGGKEHHLVYSQIEIQLVK